MIKKKKKKIYGISQNADKKISALKSNDTILQNGDNPFGADRKTLRQLCCPSGVNPNPLDHIEIDDGGVTLYTACFYIEKLPIRTKFGKSFAKLFNFPDVTSSVFIDPLVNGEGSQQLDKRINMLGTEQEEARSGDRNRFRKITLKMNSAENLAMEVESGDNMLYEVYFLFVLQASSMDGLHMMMNDFHAIAKEGGIEVASCYCAHPEAFIGSYPFNRVPYQKFGLIKNSVIKKHYLDKGCLCDIFNHTQSSFSHPNGIIAGHNMITNEPFTFDPYDSSHDGYGTIFSGKTHSGKSATIKMYLTRLIDFDYKVRSIDFDAVGTTGEYTNPCNAVGGVNYQIKPDSENILNLFEIDAEIDFDEKTCTEFPALHLTAKKSDVKNLIMTMIKDGKEITDFSLVTFIEGIVEDIIDRLYSQKGIYEGNVESLFDRKKTIQSGKYVMGRVKKTLPTISEFFYEALKDQKNNTDPLYEKAYAVVVKSMKKYVKKLNYCPHCLKTYTDEEIASLSVDDDGKTVMICSCGQKGLETISGSRPYFDGQSTIHADDSTPWINLDISQLPPGDKIVGLLVAMNFIQENYVKKNSADPRKAQEMVVLIDEVTNTFIYEEARRFVESEYRTYRKRHVSPWTSTQKLSDFDGYKETEAIVANASSIFLLKQPMQDKEYLLRATPLTESQVKEVFALGGTDEATDNKRRGEVCVIDDRKIQFVKVDYFTETEAIVVETDTSKIRDLYSKSPTRSA